METERECRNPACAMQGITVTTTKTSCLSCNEELHYASIGGLGLKPSDFDKLFGDK